MAAAERRVCSSRRGMTVLGKVPVVPKPINLPSQRLENRGLFSDVDIVPRGTCSWGSSRLFPGASGSKSRKSVAASLTPSKSGGECDIGGKLENKPISSTSTTNSGDGGGLPRNSAQFSSAKATAGQALDKNGKIEEPRTSNTCSCKPSDCQKQETTAPPLPKNGDGYIQGVSGPPGFVQCGPQGNQSRAGVSGPDLQSNGVGAGVYPNVTQQDGLPSFTGAPHHNGKKEREIIVIHMVGSPAFYGNYPPQLGYPDIYNKNGSYENFPLQFGNFEPYFGFQGHGRLDGGAQISSVSGSELCTGHEDFICYEKECYQGRKKNGFVCGNFQESSFLGGEQRGGHEALTSRSSLRPRCPSQKHLYRNAGRLRSSYHNGRLVPIEDASAVPVPEKRITLLTKLSAPKLLSLDESGVGEFTHAEYVVGSALLACGDEGKAPETFEVDLVAEDGQGEKTVTSADLKVTSEDRSFKEPELECKEVSILTTTCNDTCLHCKAEAAALKGPALKVCQACKKTSVSESASEEVSSESICRSNNTDGCAVEVKHVIFDADSSSLSAVKGQEEASLSSLTKATDDHKQLDTTILKKSLARVSPEGKVKHRLFGKKGVNDGNWKPKRPVRAVKVDIKVFAPKMRKAAGRKNTSKTLADECVSEASSSTTRCSEHPMSDISESTKLPGESETCTKVLELLLPSSLASSGDVPADASQDSAEEKPKEAASVDCIASEGRVKKRRGKNTCKTILPKDRHDSMATVDDVESFVKTVFEDISNTDVQKQEPKDADSTKDRAWRPKGPTASQCKSASKASGIRVSKADVIPKKLERQGQKLHLVYGSTCSADSSEVGQEELNAAQKSNSLSTLECCDSEALQPNKNLSFEARSTNNGRGQQSLVFRKRSAEQATLGHQSSRDASSNKEPIGSHATSSKFGPEHPKQSFDSTSSSENSLADMNCSVSASKYHMVRRRVYHVVEGSGGDYSIPSPTFPERSHLAGKCRSLQKTSLQNQAEFRKKTVNLSMGPPYTESERSEEFSGSLYMVEFTSSQLQSKGMCHSGPTANHLPSSSGIEKSKAKKHVRPGQQVSAWKPKATPLSGVLQNSTQKKDDNKIGVWISTCSEEESKEIKDLDGSSQVPASSHSDGGENCEEQTIKNVSGLPLELESVCYEPLEEIDCIVTTEDSLPDIESEEVMDFQQKSDIVVSKEEVQHTTSLKHVAEVLKAEALGSARSFEEIVLQQSMQTRSEENPAGNCRAPFKKKNAMSHEKADRYHQMMFKKYKETGQWKPKAGRNNRVSNRAGRNVSEAPMQDVLVLA